MGGKQLQNPPVNGRNVLTKEISNAESEIEDIQELKIFEKKVVSFFVMDKRARKICPSTKDSDSINHDHGGQTLKRNKRCCFLHVRRTSDHSQRLY